MRDSRERRTTGRERVVAGGGRAAYITQFLAITLLLD